MLPKLQYPIFTLFLPLSKKTIKFRPMLVKEEKMLLLAKESKDYEDMINNLSAVINNCLIDTDIDIWDIPLVEFEFIFINIRARSVGSEINLKYYDTYDRAIIHDVSIDINKIKIEVPSNFNSKIMLNDGLGIVFKVPTLQITRSIPNVNEEDFSVVNVSFDVVTSCIDYIFDSEQIYKLSDYTEQEISDFIEALDVESFSKIENFFNNLPTIKHKTSFKNSKGEDVDIILTRLEDFF